MEQEFSLLDYYTLSDTQNIVISYKGPVTDLVLSEIIEDIRSRIIQDPKAGRKMFAILIELVQNILFYSAERAFFGSRNESIGTILLQDIEDHYQISCGNLIEKEDFQAVSKRCEHLNSLDREGLRQFKRKKRMEPPEKKSKGAGIGLIQVALISGLPIEIKSVNINEDYCFFSLVVKVAKTVKIA